MKRIRTHLKKVIFCLAAMLPIQLVAQDPEEVVVPKYQVEGVYTSHPGWPNFVETRELLPTKFLGRDVILDTSVYGFEQAPLATVGFMPIFRFGKYLTVSPGIHMIATVHRPRPAGGVHLEFKRGPFSYQGSFIASKHHGSWSTICDPCDAGFKPGRLTEPLRKLFGETEFFYTWENSKYMGISEGHTITPRTKWARDNVHGAAVKLPPDKLKRYLPFLGPLLAEARTSLIYGVAPVHGQIQHRFGFSWTSK